MRNEIKKLTSVSSNLCPLHCKTQFHFTPCPYHLASTPSFCTFTPRGRVSWFLLRWEAVALQIEVFQRHTSEVRWTEVKLKSVMWSNESKFEILQGRPCLFRQDDAKLHSTCIARAWLCSERVWVLNWPACSPDLSQIENIWCIIK